MEITMTIESLYWNDFEVPDTRVVAVVVPDATVPSGTDVELDRTSTLQKRYINDKFQKGTTTASHIQASITNSLEVVSL
jgi:hypothetical protein